MSPRTCRAAAWPASPSRARSTDAFIHSRRAGRVQPDRQLRVGGGARRVRLPRLLPRRPGDDVGRPVHRGVQATRAVPRTRRSGPRDGQADHGRQGRTERAGAGGGRGPLGLAGRGGPRHRRGARCRRRHPLRRSRRAARDGRARGGHAPDRAERRSGPDRRGDRHHGRGVAHRGPRAAHRRRPAAHPGAGGGAHPRRSAHDGLHRQSARSRGVPPTRRSPMGPPSRRWPASGAYDVLAIVHDFPYRSLSSEVATANYGRRPSSSTRRATGRTSCPCTCR